jgi:hypothetical protein
MISKGVMKPYNYLDKNNNRQRDREMEHSPLEDYEKVKVFLIFLTFFA